MRNLMGLMSVMGLCTMAQAKPHFLPPGHGGLPPGQAKKMRREVVVVEPAPVYVAAPRAVVVAPAPRAVVVAPAPRPVVVAPVLVAPRPPSVTIVAPRPPSVSVTVQ